MCKLVRERRKAAWRAEVGGLCAAAVLRDQARRARRHVGGAECVFFFFSTDCEVMCVCMCVCVCVCCAYQFLGSSIDEFNVLFLRCGCY
jgi:hypothetical protein